MLGASYLRMVWYQAGLEGLPMTTVLFSGIFNSLSFPSRQNRDTGIDSGKQLKEAAFPFIRTTST
jgi:hypothetical protein